MAQRHLELFGDHRSYRQIPRYSGCRRRICQFYWTGSGWITHGESKLQVGCGLRDNWRSGKLIYHPSLYRAVVFRESVADNTIICLACQCVLSQWINLPMAGVAILVVVFALPLRSVPGDIPSKLKKVDYSGCVLTLAFSVLILMALSW